MHMFLIFLNIYLSYKVYQSFVICERSISSKHAVIYAPSLGRLWVEQWKMMEDFTRFAKKK